MEGVSGNKPRATAAIVATTPFSVDRSDNAGGTLIERRMVRLSADDEA